MPEINPRVSALRRAASDLIREPIPEDDAVDVVGEVAAIIRDLQAFNKSLKAEMAPEATGSAYAATSSRCAARSYNTEKILGRLLSADELPGRSLLDAIRYAVDKDALRLTWRWTELKALYDTLDLPMTTVRHEIEDGDPDADVGEVWTATTSVGAKHD